MTAFSPWSTAATRWLGSPSTCSPTEPRSGARPLPVPDCLNFANPDRPEVYWELEETIAGLAYACRTLDLPVVSGNVSLYNDSNGESAIYPTPVVGMIGLIDDYDKRLGAAFRGAGDFVLLIGSSHNSLGA